jgi:hypothetical protein
MKERGTIGHSVVGYFRSKEEVSALYVASRSSGEVSFALLLKDARLFGRSLEHLRAEYFSAVKSIISGPLNIVFLNTAPLSEKYWILSTWDLLLDRNRNYRCWFAEASTNEYFGSTRHPAKKDQPEWLKHHDPAPGSAGIPEIAGRP